MGSQLTRRAFLKVGAATAAVVVLAACGGGNTTPSSPEASTTSPPPTPPASTQPSAAASVSAPPAPPSASSSPPVVVGGVRLPTYVPAKGAKPELPGTADIPDGYSIFPKTPFKATQGPIANGGDITIMTETFAAPPTALDQNPAWQAVNKAVNANLKVTIVPFADYATKFPATIAGNDLPDILFMPVGQVPIDQLPEFLQAKMADLTPYLSGDAVKDYPNLAGIPTRDWKNVVYGGKIYGVTVSLAIFFWVLWVHQEVLDNAGLAVPKTTDDFKKTLQALTRNGLYGIGFENNVGYGTAPGSANGFFPSMFGAPNTWALANGKLTHAFETDQFKSALAYARDIWASGVVDPNSTNYNTISARSDFEAKKFIFRFDGLTTATYDSGARLNPPSKVRIIPLPAGDGSRGHYYIGPGNFGFVALKQASADRIKELLRVLDYFASPFGSEEYLLVHYGVKDTDYQLDANGNPILTQKGTADSMPWGSPTGSAIAHSNPVLFDPNQPDFASNIQPVERQLFGVAIDNPVWGYYSPTDQSQGPVAMNKVVDGLNAIVRGQQPLTDFDGIVKTWKSSVGDKIRAEYEQAIAGGSK